MDQTEKKKEIRKPHFAPHTAKRFTQTERTERARKNKTQGIRKNSRMDDAIVNVCKDNSPYFASHYFVAALAVTSTHDFRGRLLPKSGGGGLEIGSFRGLT